MAGSRGERPPQLSVVDALELTVLVARKDSRWHQRVAARWLPRYLEEHPAVTIEEAALADGKIAPCATASEGPVTPKMRLRQRDRGSVPRRG